MSELEKEVKLENLSGRVAADLIEKMESGVFSAIKVVSEIPSLNSTITSKEEMEEYFQKVVDLGRNLSANDLVEKMESGVFTTIKVTSEVSTLNANISSAEEMEDYYQKVLDLGRELSMTKVDLETFLVLTKKG